MVHYNYLVMIKVVFLFFILTIPDKAVSQQKIEELTLEQCVHLALARNPQYLASIYNVKSKKKDIDEAEANLYYPNIEVGAGYTYTKQEPESTFPTANDTFSTSLSINKVLYDFGRLSDQVSIAEENHKIALLEHQDSLNTLIFNVKSAFYNVLLQQEKLKVIYEGNQILKENVQYKSRNYNKGRGEKSDYLRIKIQYENDRINVQNAKKSLINALNQLYTIIGFPVIENLNSVEYMVSGKFLSLTESGRLELYDDLNKSVERGKTLRVDIAKAYRQKKILELNKDINSTGYKPTISAFGKMQMEWSKQVRLTNTGFKLSDNMKRSTTYSAGVEITIPIDDLIIPNSAVHSKNESLEYQIKSSNAQLKNVVAVAEKEIAENLLALKEAKKNIAIREEVMKLSEESFKIAYKKFNSGTLDYLNYKDIEQQYREAKQSYYQELYNYSIAYLNWLKSMGEDLR